MANNAMSFRTEKKLVILLSGCSVEFCEGNNCILSTTLLKRRDNNVYIHKKKLKCCFFVTSYFNFKAESSTVFEIKVYIKYTVSAL